MHSLPQGQGPDAELRERLQNLATYFQNGYGWVSPPQQQVNLVDSGPHLITPVCRYHKHVYGG